MRRIIQRRGIGVVLGASCAVFGGAACGSAPEEAVGSAESASSFGVPQSTGYLRVAASAESRAKGIHSWIVRDGGPSWAGVEMPTGTVLYALDAQDRYVAHVSFAEAHTDHGMAIEIRGREGHLVLEPQELATVSTIGVLRATYGANASAPPGNATSDFAASCGHRPSCDYTIPEDILARNAAVDPAPGVPKSFVAEWACPSGPRSITVPAEARGKTIHVDCANPVEGPPPEPVDCNGTLPMRLIVNTLDVKTVELLGLAGNDFQKNAPPQPNDPENCAIAKATKWLAYVAMSYGCRTAAATLPGLVFACLVPAAGVALAAGAARIACRPPPPQRCTSDAQCVAAQGQNSRCADGQCVPKWFQDPAPQPGTTAPPAPPSSPPLPPISVPYPSPQGGPCYDDWDCAGAMACRLARCS
ncbi:MAG: hypothetical protein JST00_01710 [Deltaproteobacteria bacterium]|nr:hypothetical protein [Deltaproteobacteria bacterium]